MTAEEKGRLEAGGVNVDDAMQRFMNNEKLLARFLKKLKDDTSYNDLVKAVAEENCDKAFEAAHTLKGISGNLALTRLNVLVGEQTEYLRGANRNFEAAAAMMPQITASYEEALKTIDEVYGE